MKRFRIRFGWLASGWAVMAGIIAGVLIGLHRPALAEELAIVGDLYLTFLKMCVIPIMITAIVPSLGRLLSSSHIARHLKKMAAVFVLLLLAVSAVGLTAGLLGGPGNGLAPEARQTLGQTLVASEGGSAATETTGAAQSSGGLAGFLSDMIPANIFTALVDGNSLQILFFSLLFGITVGFFPASSSEQLLSILDLVFRVFQKIIAWSLYALPFALLGIMAGQTAQTGIAVLLAMGKFVMLVIAVSVLLIGLSALLVARKLRMRYLQTWRPMKTVLVVGFGTRNSIATLPALLDALRDEFRLDRETIHLVVPLGIILCRYSMVAVFALTLVFLSQLYYVPLGWDGLLIALLGAVIAAVAGAGSPGVVSLSMLSLATAPLGLPFSTAIVLLLAVTPVIDPFITAMNVHLNGAAAVLIADRKQADGDTPAIGSGTASPEVVMPVASPAGASVGAVKHGSAT